jgi:hypothetical protein
MPANGFCQTGATRNETLNAFADMYANRGEYRMIDSAPPQANVPQFVNHANALATRHAKRSQRLRLAARDGLVDSIEAAAVLDELYEVANRNPNERHAGSNRSRNRRSHENQSRYSRTQPANGPQNPLWEHREFMVSCRCRGRDSSINGGEVYGQARRPTGHLS